MPTNYKGTIKLHYTPKGISQRPPESHRKGSSLQRGREGKQLQEQEAKGSSLRKRGSEGKQPQEREKRREAASAGGGEVKGSRLRSGGSEGKPPQEWGNGSDASTVSPPWRRLVPRLRSCSEKQCWHSNPVIAPFIFFFSFLTLRKLLKLLYLHFLVSKMRATEQCLAQS